MSDNPQNHHVDRPDQSQLLYAELKGAQILRGGVEFLNGPQTAGIERSSTHPALSNKAGSDSNGDNRTIDFNSPIFPDVKPAIHGDPNHGNAYKPEVDPGYSQANPYKPDIDSRILQGNHNFSEAQTGQVRLVSADTTVDPTGNVDREIIEQHNAAMGAGLVYKP